MDSLKKLIDKLSKAKSLLVLTGAGISKESGLPTYRGENCLLKYINPILIATKQAYVNNPEKSWKWYQELKEEMHKSKPNVAHIALANLEKLYPNFLLVTQNVDGLHQKAGNRNIIELHGNLEELRCLKENKIINNESRIYGNNGISYCRCGSILRPNVVWFGEKIDQKKFSEVNKFTYSNVDVCLSIGTSLVVYPAAEIPIVAHYKGAYTVDINIKSMQEDKYLDDKIEGNVVDILPEIYKGVKNGK